MRREMMYMQTQNHGGAEHVRMVSPVKASALIRVVLMVLLAVMFVCCTTGCRDTNVLKKIVYSQDSPNIDYDNPQKWLISNEQSEIESESVPAEETSDDATRTTLEQNVVVYGSEPNSPEFTTKASVYAKKAGFSGIEATFSVHPYYSEDKDAIDYEVPADDADEDETENPDDAVDSNTSQNLSESSDAMNPELAGGMASADSLNGTADESDSGAGALDGDTQGGEPPEEEEQTQQEEKKKIKKADTIGAFDELPEVDTMAAFGAAAVVVQMIAGEGALVAADEELLSSKFSDVFADEGARDIVCGWTGDGTKPSQMDVDAIIASGADTVVVYYDTYLEGLSKADQKKLDEAGIFPTVIYTMSNSTYIKENVKNLGTMLKNSKKAKGVNGKNSAEMATAYIEWHDSLISSCVKANGGVLPGTGAMESKNTDGFKYVGSTETGSTYTLLIDGWDETARYQGTTFAGYLESEYGVGTCTLGNTSRPTNFYIQVGGLLNNAAVKAAASSTKKWLLWQFNANTLTFNKTDFTYSGSLSEVTDVSASAWSGILFHTMVNANEVTKLGDSFGSDAFPKVIVTTQEMKENLVNDSRSEKGVYHPYSLQYGILPGGNSAYGMMGYFGFSVESDTSSGDTLAMGCVGAVASTLELASGFSSQIPKSAVEVNPTGLFSSWVEEGTVESVLEAAWVNDVVNGSGTAVGYKSLITEFYKTFYRYSLSTSERSTLLDGPTGQ